jgi:hypothetical protein
MAVNKWDSIVEGALARVLRAAYLDVDIGKDYRQNEITEFDVARDEFILRQALFGDKPKAGDTK